MTHRTLFLSLLLAIAFLSFDIVPGSRGPDAAPRPTVSFDDGPGSGGGYNP